MLIKIEPITRACNRPPAESKGWLLGIFCKPPFPPSPDPNSYPTQPLARPPLPLLAYILLGFAIVRDDRTELLSRRQKLAPLFLVIRDETRIPRSRSRLLSF